ncbi:hypothetical protein [Bacillus haynesii]|uniref:hypothetical protein n=1 Tax=Bacillus haynesii TaxID=1925021 RepID=UPI0022812671|nr:hypothetical protein [Bacillus haynesii]MCY7999575.1 hypothetical protein [Bacillus haynesii]
MLVRRYFARKIISKKTNSYELGPFYSGGRISNQDEYDHRYQNHQDLNHPGYQQPESTGKKENKKP